MQPTTILSLPLLSALALAAGFSFVYAAPDPTANPFPGTPSPTTVSCVPLLIPVPMASFPSFLPQNSLTPSVLMRRQDPPILRKPMPDLDDVGPVHKGVVSPLCPVPFPPRTAPPRRFFPRTFLYHRIGITLSVNTQRNRDSYTPKAKKKHVLTRRSIAGDWQCLCKDPKFGYGIRDCTKQNCPHQPKVLEATLENTKDWCTKQLDAPPVHH